MQNTANYYLNKPEETDYININDLNANADIIDGKLKENEDAIMSHKNENASLTFKGHVQLSNSINSTADTLAATPYAVKQSYDRADSAFNDTNELRSEFHAFKSALTEGFTANQFSDGLTTLDAFNVTSGYYNQSLSRLEV